jgi:hypothetical protein
MQKALLASILFASVLIPIAAAREKNAWKGLKKAVYFALAFNLLYLFAVRLIYPRL